MSVDFEAIAQRGRCDVSSLRLAQPLLEQGYTPPFLSRYRRDELGGVDEASLWTLAAAMRNEQEIAARKENLQQAWKQTSLADPSIGHAIDKASSVRVLSRLARRMKGESSTTPSDAARLAVRVLNPQKGDGEDFAAIAANVQDVEDAGAAVAGLDDALAERLPGDPRIVAAAVRWLAKHAQVKIAKIHDPHVGEDAGNPKDAKKKKSDSRDQAPSATAAMTEPAPAKEFGTAAEPAPASGSTGGKVAEAATAKTEPSVAAEIASAGEDATPAVAQATAETPVEPPAENAEASEKAEVAEPEVAEPKVAEPKVAEPKVAEPNATEPNATEPNATEAKAEAGGTDAAKPAKKKAAAKKPAKKVSPRQRRRRWLVSVLKPLQGKKFSGDKLSAFQVVMLGRALRSQVAVCQFEYDATKLVAELQRTAGGFNRAFEDKLKAIVLQHEAAIRDAAETAWWDDLQERASGRLVNVTADTLRRHINRGAVDAKVVLSIDAVGPRTAATTIVSADGRLLHSEDLPCQLSATQRSAAVARMGELIHSHHVDLIVISNGPARRSMMVAVGDLIKQSPEKSVRWTLAERGGADAYSSSSVADQEMRSTPRRFRAAAWLAFSILQPAQAMAKVDPLKLRLSSFQRELSDEALAPVLGNIMISGASRGGVDINSAPQSWLARLPGVSETVAAAIDKSRRESLFTSRDAILALEGWTSEVESRQSLPFLRVFGSEQPLDGTLIHPGDYPLAQKLAKALEIELPPPSPPGYEAPDYSTASSSPAASEVKTIEVVQTEQPAKVEDFTASGEKASEFAIDADAVADDASKVSSSESNAETATAEQEASTAEEPAAESPAAEDVPAAEAQEPVAGAGSPESGESTATEPVSVPEAVKRPRPERTAVEKCIKEWQIGKQRTHQIVHWLCDPFGDSDVSGMPPAVLTSVPSMKNLSQGDQVIGVVVGVMPFGVFVELAPDCSGLVHVSRVSDSYVEDLHEAVQVGDVVTAWVTGIDEKKRRVGLSALSPEREAELEATRRNQRSGGNRSGGNRSGGSRSGGHQSGGTGRGRSDRGGQARGGQGSGGSGQGVSRRDGPSSGGRGGHGGGRDNKRSGGGRPRDNRGGRSREKRVESYRVVAKKEEKPLTDAMAKGDEPMRSFGDLAQFLGTGKAAPPKKPSKPKKEKPVAPKSEVAPEGDVASASEVADKSEGDSAVATQSVESNTDSSDGSKPETDVPAS